MHKEVIVLIVNDKKEILLQKRSANKKHFPNMWAILSGHVENESFEEAAIREVKEELDLKIESNELKSLAEKDIVKDGNRHITKYYLLISNKGVNDFTIQKEELSEVKWFNIEYVIELLEKKDENFVYSDKILELMKEIRNNL